MSIILELIKEKSTLELKLKAVTELLKAYGHNDTELIEKSSSMQSKNELILEDDNLFDYGMFLKLKGKYFKTTHLLMDKLRDYYKVGVDTLVTTSDFKGSLKDYCIEFKYFTTFIKRYPKIYDISYKDDSAKSKIIQSFKIKK